MMQSLWNVLIYAIWVRYATASNPQVNTQSGIVEGRYLTSRGGRQFEAFLGIPYAKPPIGERRFRVAEAADSWIGVLKEARNATECIQSNVYLRKIRNITFGQEDCLYLNVYTPKASISSLLGVMVFIHGGGWRSGSGSSHFYGPDYLLDKDIVLVTFNYRIGPLGFLSLEDNVLPGNLGLKDQVLALRWVQQNVAAFGGNPNSVTIFGQSAGGASVHYHMISPLSKGLFHRAIAQSGNALCPWAYLVPGVARLRTLKLAEMLGCPANTSAEIVQCLRMSPAEDFVKADLKFAEWDIDPVMPFSAVKESNFEGAFLTIDPWTSETNVPFLTGITSGEGVYKLASLLEFGEIDKLNSDFEKLLPISLMYRETSSYHANITQAIKEFYFGGNSIGTEQFKKLVDMYTDAWFLFGAEESVKRHLGPVHYYYFDYEGHYSIASLRALDINIYGVSHFEEMKYLFTHPNLYPNQNLTGEDRNISEHMIAWWTNFAIYGNPTPEGSDVLWKHHTSTGEYLHIKQGGSVMQTKLLQERVNFWETLPIRNSTLQN